MTIIPFTQNSGTRRNPAPQRPCGHSRLHTQHLTRTRPAVAPEAAGHLPAGVSVDVATVGLAWLVFAMFAAVVVVIG